MKKKFSPAWKSSSQVRKKRKYLANAPKHLKRKIMGANLEKELRKKHGKRSFPIRKGDEVKVMRGKFAKKTGKVSDIYVKKMRVAIEGIQRKKNDGTKINVYFSPSSLQIQKLNLEDKKRVKALERKGTEKKMKKVINEKTQVKKESKKTESKLKEEKNAS
jgi:large subunit ribosomal protein L24